MIASLYIQAAFCFSHVAVEKYWNAQVLHNYKRRYDVNMFKPYLLYFFNAALAQVQETFTFQRATLTL